MSSLFYTVFELYYRGKHDAEIKYTIGLALKKSIGGEETKWHKALGNGMEFNWLLLWVEGCKSCKVCKVFDVRG